MGIAKNLSAQDRMAAEIISCLILTVAPAIAVGSGYLSRENYLKKKKNNNPTIETIPKPSPDLHIIGFGTTLCSHVVSEDTLCLYSFETGVSETKLPIWGTIKAP